MKNLIYSLPLLLLPACNNGEQNNKHSDSTVIIKPASQVSEKREKVSSTPVAEYKQKVPDELNDWYFTVKVYETSATFGYRIQLQYQELRAEDNFTVPNLGFNPVISIKKGPEDYSCVIGFHDKEGLFKEYKLVTAKNGKVNIKTIGHYAVSTVSRVQ
ncbi:hypothetical protein [Filimonas effusa]|uniref:Uncharacterized protein n=1 Tax=Filimonas effusa TaxID=2508721 RepID=A0A4Q1DA44_9BACT|nr:hypothetical protein [Filimonas effusa]RXK86241.1 hypothetical protein ESB13_05385 [Filimonas effusa]